MVSPLRIQPLSSSALLSWLQPFHARISSGRSLAKLPHSKKSPWLVDSLPASEQVLSKIPRDGMRSESTKESSHYGSVCQQLCGEPMLFSLT